MTVKTKEELQGLLDQGWHLYHHSRQNRWYVFKDELREGKKHRTTRIVDARLDKICEELYAQRGVSAGEIQDMRWSEAAVKDISEKTGLSRTAVYNAFEKDPEESVFPRSRESKTEAVWGARHQEQGVEASAPQGEVPWHTWAVLGALAGAAAIPPVIYIITNWNEIYENLMRPWIRPQMESWPGGV